MGACQSIYCLAGEYGQNVNELKMFATPATAQLFLKALYLSLPLRHTPSSSLSFNESGGKGRKKVYLQSNRAHKDTWKQGSRDNRLGHTKTPVLSQSAPRTAVC